MNNLNNTSKEIEKAKTIRPALLVDDIIDFYFHPSCNTFISWFHEHKPQECGQVYTDLSIDEQNNMVNGPIYSSLHT